MKPILLADWLTSLPFLSEIPSFIKQPSPGDIKLGNCIISAEEIQDCEFALNDKRGTFKEGAD